MHGGMKTYTGSAADARQYVEADRGRADDYYLSEGTGIAERYAASPRTGVRRMEPLTGDAYEAWVAGVEPMTGASKGRLRNDDRAVRFVEVTVNGPKSWSLAAELHPDISAAYDAAQDRAATQIVGWLAEHATTRVGSRGAQVQVPVQQIEAATVRHYTSRAGDPHRHLHLQINARVFAANAWRGLHTVGVRDSLDAINGIGHAAVMTDPGFREALAAHCFTLKADGEVEQLAPFTGSFSARAAQIGRNIELYETQWRATNAGQEPDPALRRSWDARAWADGRPDKIRPEAGADLTARWVTELHALGYRDQHQRVPLEAMSVGSLDRDGSVEVVLVRLATWRSGWNAADVRGEVEQLLARANVVVEATVRTELAEDLTARALTRCVPLLVRAGLPEHIRALTSQRVLAVEHELADRLAARAATTAAESSTPALDVAHVLARRLDATQVAAAAGLASAARLVVVEGAAGAGKTTTLSATRDLLEARGHRLVVVTPTLKAAQVAEREVGTRTGSAAGLAFRHGFRWDEHGRWTRLVPGQSDPLTGAVYTGPGAAAVLRAGDLLLVDEAGMLDQDTARALLTIADEHDARVAMVGDRHQLSAVGRGGVLDLAARLVAPEACLTLDTVHRFARQIVAADGTIATVPDVEYADLSLAMRTGDDAATVFEALIARGQIRVHGSDGDRRAALADLAVADLIDGTKTMVVADTREQVAELNAAIRDRLVAAGRVNDDQATATRAGQRVGVGDRVVTRRNDRDLDIANRDTWTITAVHQDGAITVTGEHGPRELPASYVTPHVELAYVSTVHGVQGDTATSAHVVIGEHTGAASAYVGMTRGRTANVAHLAADSMDEARERWVAVFARDRADLGPAHAARQAETEAARYAEPRPLEQVLAELHRWWTLEQDCLDRLAHQEQRRDLLRKIVPLRAARDREVPPLEDVHRQARETAHQAQLNADAAKTVLTRETDRIRDSLISSWDAQRDTARRHAQTIRDGTGRFGQRGANVTRAKQELTVWADAWRPTVPDLPVDTERLVDRLLLLFENRYELYDTLDHAARPQAVDAHPDAVAALADAESAAQMSRTAWQTYCDSDTYYDRALGHYGNLARTEHPEKALDDAERADEAISSRLTATQSKLANLHGEPAIRILPVARLEQERAAWRLDHDTQSAHTRHVNAAGYAAERPSGHQLGYEPVDVAARRDSGRGISR